MPRCLRVLKNGTRPENVSFIKLKCQTKPYQTNYQKTVYIKSICSKRTMSN